MEIREINDIEEIRECLKIYNHYILTSTATLEEKEVRELDYLVKIRLIKKKYPVYVAIEDGVIVGFSYLDEFNFRSAYKITADLTIYIKEDYRGKGIGKALYQKIEEEAKKIKIENIVSLITSSNKDSIEFHKRLGFEIKGTLDNVAKKFDKYESLTYMIKKID